MILNCSIGKKNNEQGATLVEFALCSIIIFGTIGFLIDFGLASFQHAVLRYATNKAVRELSTNVQGFRTAESLQKATEARVLQIIHETFGLNPSTLLPPQVSTPADSSGGFSLLLQLEQKVLCFFCIFPGIADVQSAQQNISINDKCFEGNK